MRSISVFSTAAFVYCVGTAVAVQPDKVKLNGVPRSAAATTSRTIEMGKKGQPIPKGLVTLVQPSDEQDFHVAIGAPQGRARKLLFNERDKNNLPTPLKTQNIKVKKDSDDPDRRLTREGNIRGGKTEDSTRRKRSLQDYNTAFEADVTMPIRLQSMMKKTSADSNRHLMTVICGSNANGQEWCCVFISNELVSCYSSSSPEEGMETLFWNCPYSGSVEFSECQSCDIVPENRTTDDDDLENEPHCLSCSICSDGTVTYDAYDCSNLLEGDCVIMDCAGNCAGSSSTPPGTPPPTTTPPSTPPPTSPGTRTDPDPTTSNSTPAPSVNQGPPAPDSSVSMRKLGFLSISATVIVAFGF